MGKAARKYTDQTIKKLFGLSDNQCSFPNCTHPMVNEKNAKDSNICHIEGANEGSERYRSDMTDLERADYENLILLCVQHHDETNDFEKYTVSDLIKMKQEHISAAMGKKIQTNPSMIRNTINAIAQLDFEENPGPEDLNSYNISLKLDYNSVKKYAPLIQEYKVYHHRINTLYDELELQGSLKKGKILNLIQGYYLKAKGKYVENSTATSMNLIREHADDIISDIVNNLCDRLTGSGLYEDDIIFGIDLVVVDAFMRCKILEEPKAL